jgi:hypothetical protein
MKCVWTQKVSLLIDGELERADAREVERHLDTCGDCREAQADFLSLRRQIADYRVDLDAFARQRALKSILASGASGAKLENNGGAASRRRRVERFAGVLGMPRLSPAGLAALLLLLVGVAAGIVSFINTRRPAADIANIVPATTTPAGEARGDSNRNAQPAPAATPNDAKAGVNNGGETLAGNKQRQAGRESAQGANRGAKIDQAREGRRPRGIESARNKVKQPSPALSEPRVNVAVAETAGNNVEAIDNGVGPFESSDAGDDLLTRRAQDVTNDSKTARHVEQAQLLLRSFRNARVADTGRRASSDIAYDKRQSKKLLYQNIVLRREAASRGNLPVESLLDSLEPILIDIANLPDNPAPADVREINERMRRKNLVAMLQVSSVESASARSY